MKRKDTVEDHKNKITFQRRKTVKMEDKEQSKMDLELFKVYAQKNSLRGPKDLKNCKYKTKRK